MTEPLAAALVRLHEEGQRVSVLSMVDEDWSGVLGDVPVQRVRHEALLAEEVKA